MAVERKDGLRATLTFRSTKKAAGEIQKSWTHSLPNSRAQSKGDDLLPQTDSLMSMSATQSATDDGLAEEDSITFSASSGGTTYKDRKEAKMKTLRKLQKEQNSAGDKALAPGSSHDIDLLEVLQPPDKHEVLARFKNMEFSVRELERMRQIFKEYKWEGTDEVHVDSLSKILEFLGYLKISPEAVQTMVSRVTRYSTMAWDEFQSFMSSAMDYEIREVRENFERFDEDNSGELSIQELEELLKSLGITPFRSTIADALAVVDEDDSGSLDFHEFVQLLQVYRKTEGFARAEVQKLYRTFGRFADERTVADGSKRGFLKADTMKDALLQMFGSQATAIAQELEENLLSRPKNFTKQAVKKPGFSSGPGHGNDEPDPGMSFKEFLVWARQLREAEVKVCKSEFEQCDTDGGGTLEPDEIRTVLLRLGYTPLRSVIYDFIDAFDIDRGGTLDFDEFVNMMELFRRSDGFTREDVKEFSETFATFDTQHEGEIDSVQVGAMLRSLGFNTESDRAEVMVKTVDVNGSGSLDFAEFLRLMRLHREEELWKVKAVFDLMALRYSADGSVVMDLPSCQAALIKMGHPSTIARLMSRSVSNLTDNVVDFDALVGASDGCRRCLMAKMRKQAGFTNEKLAEIQETFNMLDADGGGEIDREELVEFCTMYGIDLKTKQDQKLLLQLIDEARTSARASGVSEKEAGKKGSPSVPFWTFVHLNRVLQTREDKKKFAKKKAASFAKDASLTKEEVSELRHLFDAEVNGREDGIEDKLSLSGLWSLLEKMGVNLTPMDREQVKAKLFIMVKGEEKQMKAFGFDVFCQLVIWLATSNFGAKAATQA